MKPITLLCVWMSALLGSAVIASGENLFDESRAGALDPLNGKMRFLRAGQPLYTDKELTLKERPAANTSTSTAIAALLASIVHSRPAATPALFRIATRIIPPGPYRRERYRPVQRGH